MTTKELEKKARQIRATCIQMAHDGKQGHLSSSLACVGVLVALFYGFLRGKPGETPRDRFILSKGHGVTPLYAIFADKGWIPLDSLHDYAKEGSALPNHACKDAMPLLEMSSGSLGHGIGYGAGMALALKMSGSDEKVVVLISDGECNEGLVWESINFASANKLDNLMIIVDQNGIQAVGSSYEIMFGDNLGYRFNSFGCHAINTYGSQMNNIIFELGRLQTQEKPSVLIDHSKLGVSFMEGDVLWHYRCPSDDDLARALEELGEKPIHI